MRWLLLAAIAPILAACSSEPRGPEAAFDRLRVAVGSQDPRLLYRALDTDSRWAVDSIWDYQRKIAAILEAKAPPAVRERERRRVEAAVRAASPAELFAALAASRGDPFAPLGGSVEALGTFVRTQGNDVVTSTGKLVPMARGPDGAWGYAAWRDELARRRDAAANDLKRIEADVARDAK